MNFHRVPVFVDGIYICLGRPVRVYVNRDRPARFRGTRIPPVRTGLGQRSPRAEARHRRCASGQFKEVSSDQLGVLA